MSLLQVQRLEGMLHITSDALMLIEGEKVAFINKTFEDDIKSRKEIVNDYI